MSERMVLKGGLVLDPATRTARTLDIAIEAGTIVAVGKEDSEEIDRTEVFDMSDRMIIPGLVNAHTHGHGSLGKGQGDRWSLELLLNAGFWISGGRTHEAAYLATILNAAEMVRRGCTAVYDLTWEIPVPTVDGMHHVARAYDTIGMRALIAPMMMDMTLYRAVPGLFSALPERLQKQMAAREDSSGTLAVDACRELLANSPFDTDKLQFGIAPSIPVHCTDEFLGACQTLIDEFDCPVHTHLAESRLQALVGKQRYGRSLTAHLESVGMLSEKFTGAHGIWLDCDDMARLAHHGCSIAHNPGSNLRLGSGVAAANALRRAGVNVGIGTDGSNSSDHQNMFEAIRLCACVSRITTHETDDWISSAEALDMATRGGAATLGMAGQIGRIAPGYKADLAILDLDDLTYVPLNDPFNQLVYSDDGSSVRSVMINGRFVYQDRKFMTVDIDRIVRDVERIVGELNVQSDENRKLVALLEPIVKEHCMCFMRQPHHVNRIIPALPEPCGEHPITRP